MWHQSVDAELRLLLSIPEEVALSACITLGRPLGSHGTVRRRPLAELVFEDSWGAHRNGRAILRELLIRLLALKIDA